MKIAITGGAGYVGCRLSEHFLKQGHEVICIDLDAMGSYSHIKYH